MDKLEVYCPICNELFNSEEEMLIHHSEKHGSPFEKASLIDCPECGKHFLDLETMLSHYEIHSPSYDRNESRRKKSGKGIKLPAPIAESPTTAWYLLPLLLGILGGLISYVSIEDKDKQMAQETFYLGVGISILWILIGLAIFH